METGAARPTSLIDAARRNDPEVLEKILLHAPRPGTANRVSIVVPNNRHCTLVRLRGPGVLNSIT
jgi:hypothetical protein